MTHLSYEPKDDDTPMWKIELTEDQIDDIKLLECLKLRIY